MDYLLDGRSVSFMQLIEAAREEGYEGDGGMFLTSGAARVLRENGHVVDELRAP